MSSFFVAILTIPLATLTIWGVYRWQYHAPTPVRRVLIGAHVSAVTAIIVSYWLLCLKCYLPSRWQYAGWTLFIVGGGLFWLATFSHRSCLVPDEQNRVVNRGPYRIVRHPIYSGGLLAALGLIAVAPAWQVVVAWGELFLALWALMRFEEGELTERMGEPYLRYMASTKRLVPGLF